MRALPMVLAAGWATVVCSRTRIPERPGRSAYGLVTSQTSITISIDIVSDIREYPSRTIELVGDGTLRYTVGTDTKLGHLSQAELVRVLDELAKLDFLNMHCTEKMRFDHGSFPTVTLVVPSGTASVVLEDCWNHEPALRDIVEHVKDLADRATAD